MGWLGTNLIQKIQGQKKIQPEWKEGERVEEQPQFSYEDFRYL